MIRKELGIFYPVKFTMILRSGISCGIWEWRREFATPRWDTTPRPRYSTPSPWGSSPGRGAEGPAPFKTDTLTNVTHKFIIIHRYFNIHYSIDRYYTIANSLIFQGSRGEAEPNTPLWYFKKALKVLTANWFKMFDMTNRTARLQWDP